jgi:leucyl aminopeptidase (aminopeptidase T)
MAMEAIVSSAAAALVGAMATDAWQQARAAVMTWWRRIRPRQAVRVDAALVESRDRVLTARRAGDEKAESDMVAAWGSRLTDLLRDDPSLKDELRQLIEEEIAPLLRREGGARTGSHEFRAEASGHGRVYQAGRDQNIHGP